MKQLIAIMSFVALAACDLGGPEEFNPRFVRLLKDGAPAMQFGVVETKRNGTILLEKRFGLHEIWLTPDGGTITTERGLLHSTRGFGEGLLASELNEPVELVLGGREGFSDRFHTYLDGDDKAVSRTYRCSVTDKGPRDIRLRSGVAKTRLMEEECRSLNQEFKNLYWVELRTKTIVQSRQWAGPFVGAISTRIVR